MNHHLTTAAGVLLLTCLCTGCSSNPSPSDTQATQRTCALYERMFELRSRGVMLGHQDDIAYGHQRYEPGFSDVQQITGDYPAVIGWEIGHVELGKEFSLDSVYFDDMRRGIAATDARGGITTISWHGDNILTGGSTWDCTRNDVVASILPDGTAHLRYIGWLDKVADFLLSLRDGTGEAIPVVLRLYHEHTRSWFWWGADFCTPEAYKALWRMTVAHLRDTRGVHNVLYAYSPTEVDDEANYLERYPGDEWVDVVGFDLYHFGSDEGATQRYIDAMRHNLAIVTAYATKAGKLPVMAETGLEGIPFAEYFTRVVTPAIEPYDIAWILFWRNAWEEGKPGHFYLPYKGHAAEADFKAFVTRKEILMNNDIQ